MNAEKPAGEMHASAADDDESQAAAAGDNLSFHALAVAADPTLTGQATAANSANPAWQGEPAAYDGHVALELDPSPLPDIDSMLDLLTVSHDLFDVPAMDVGGAPGDSAAT